jgi:hypothetical protein
MLQATSLVFQRANLTTKFRLRQVEGEQISWRIAAGSKRERMIEESGPRVDDSSIRGLASNWLVGGLIRVGSDNYRVDDRNNF